MNFSPLRSADDLAEFASRVNRFLDLHLTTEVHEAERATGDGFNVHFHRALASEGWIAPEWPTSEGGAGLDAVRAQLLLDAIWHRNGPDILRATTVLIANSLRPWTTPALLARILPAVGRGETVICQGITEPDSGSDASAARTTADRRGDGWSIRGSKMFTSHAHNSTHCYVLARTNRDIEQHKGLSVFLVSLKRPGISIQPVQTIGHERTNMVFYDDVFVEDEWRIGPIDAGWAVLNTQLADEHGSGVETDVPMSYVFGTQLMQLWEAVASWSRQDDSAAGGAPIQSPEVQFALARIAMDIELIRDAPLEMSRVISSDLLIRDTELLLDIVGAEGLLEYGEAGSIADGLLEFRYRSAQASAVYGGSVEIHRNVIAAQVLGLPRPVRPSRQGRSPK